MFDLRRARELLEAARDMQRRALAAQAAEPAQAGRLYAEAIAQLHAAAQAPDAPSDALRLLAAALMETGNLAAATPVLERAAAQPGRSAGLLVELGTLYLGLARQGEARRCFEDALVLDPGHAAAHASLAVALLGAGNFARGWDEYEWRLRTGFDATPRGAMPYAPCDGPVAQSNVFVGSEQGIGDEIMFASCFADLIADSGRCVLECSGRLLPLFARSFPAAQVIARNRSAWPDRERTGDVDCGIWAGSLPRLYRRAADAFRGDPYLRPDTALVERWRVKLDALGARVRVGLAWSGGLPETGRAQRSLPLAALAPLFELPDTAFVSLELMDRSAEAREVSVRGGAKLQHWQGVAADPERLAALIGALDLVICVPNASAHLAGAIGKEAWVLVAGAPTWRYLWQGDRVPWYRTMRVLRRGPDEALVQWIPGVRDRLARHFGL
ncbi:MAG: hypothetical protein AB7O31_14455 [Burkholderiales bacterium]